MRYLLTVFLLLPLSLQAQSRKWADSMIRAIEIMEVDSTINLAHYEDWDDLGKARDAHMKKYMKTCIALGNYFERQFSIGKLPTLDSAIKYYWLVTILDSQTDSDLGDNDILIDMREKLGMKVANLYNSGEMKGGDTVKNYVIGRYLKCPLINAPQRMNWMISDDTSNVEVRFFVGSFTLCDDAMAVLQNVAALMKMYPDKRMVVFGNGNYSYYSQQLGWERSEAVIASLTKCGIKRDRFIHHFGQPGEATLVQMRFAMPLESGPSRTVPPFPLMRY